MINTKKSLPSFFTSLGLISGCISIVISVSRGDLNLAGYFILAAAVFDFIDGMAARVLNSISEFGKQLDSLADVVSFGVAPAMILYRLVLMSYVGSSPGADFDVMNPTFGESVILYSAFLVAVFSALRLAKFNLDQEQLKNFKGLPTPANAVLICAIGFIAESSRELPFAGFTFNRYFLLTVIVLSCFLLVSNIRMFSLKFSTFTIQKNIMRYLFLIFAAGLILAYQLPGLAPVIVLYIVMSLINNWFVKME
jgi:CDP-diacylglycerol---serine O-phosphatidyltransferase